jgi:hypothetical protein
MNSPVEVLLFQEPAATAIGAKKCRNRHWPAATDWSAFARKEGAVLIVVKHRAWLPVRA